MQSHLTKRDGNGRSSRERPEFYGGCVKPPESDAVEGFIENRGEEQRGRSAAGSLAVAACRRFSMSTDRVADVVHHQLLGSTTTTISGAS